VPRKIRQLKADLRQAGFRLKKGGGKGSHTAWTHPAIAGRIILSGADGADAKPYQEEQVREAIAKVRQAE